ncbi:hypothetical protein PROFUN_02318 [Planoprotostelium fungivorum]|uniref:Uncharacterized protein n=1 Tax=Planoprotostelium fungivorum TaxID=1890364 RepID=A0A2P6NYK9_9EUKA|nr:hypothetical protein PROFUN_02318 [Planoprotostelium fungivorum]
MQHTNTMMILSILLFSTALAVNSNTFTPAAVRDGNTYFFTGFGPYLYTFNLPSLSLQKTDYDASGSFGQPATFDGRYAYFSDGGNGSYRLDTTNNLAFEYLANTPAPEATYDYYAANPVYDSANNSYTFNYGNATNNASIIKASPSGQVLATARLVGSQNPSEGFSFLQTLSIQNDSLYVIASQQDGYRSTFDYDFFSLSSSDLSIHDGPVHLPGSGSSGCPVPPRQCGVPVLNSLSVYNGSVVYTYTISTSVGEVGNMTSGPFQVYVVSYNRDCGFSRNFFDDEGTQPSTIGNSTCNVSTSTSSATSSSAAATSSSSVTPIDTTPSASSNDGGSATVNNAGAASTVNGDANPVTQVRDQAGSATRWTISISFVLGLMLLV